MNDDTIIDNIYSKLCGYPLVLQKEDITHKKEEIKIRRDQHPSGNSAQASELGYIPGVRFIFSIPYTGSSLFWDCIPSKNLAEKPIAKIIRLPDDKSGILEIVLESVDSDINDMTIFRRTLDKTLQLIKEHIELINADIEKHNDELSIRIQQNISARRKRLGVYSEISKNMGIPLERNPRAPDMAALPLKRNLIKSTTASKHEESECYIYDEDYEYILKVIRHEGCTYETTRETFMKLDEEDYRNIILAHLNGHYWGLATGETFRCSGKTDIRVEFENRAAFIAECKIWYGDKEFIEAVDQLLSYPTWRDIKTSLIVFNKHNIGFTAIQNKIPELINNHPNYVPQDTIAQAGEWRFKLRSLEDDARIITVHVFLFDLYVNKKLKEIKHAKGK